VTDANPPITGDYMSDDPAKDMRFVLTSKLNIVRICFCNEGRDGGRRQATLSGNMIKKVIASGGDTVVCRRMGKDEVMTRPNTIFFMSFNEVPKSDPMDAMETARLVVFPNKFDNRCSGVGVRKSDPKVKSWIKNTPWVGDAVAWAVFNVFSETSGSSLKPPASFQTEFDTMVEGVLSDPFHILNQRFEQR